MIYTKAHTFLKYRFNDGGLIDSLKYKYLHRFPETYIHLNYTTFLLMIFLLEIKDPIYPISYDDCHLLALVLMLISVPISPKSSAFY